MAVRHEGDVLQEVAEGLLETFGALRGAVPFELVEAEVEIPFVGKPGDDTPSAGLSDFRDVSLLAEDIGRSNASELWRIRISVAQGQAAVLRVEKYDAPAVA